MQVLRTAHRTLIRGLHRLQRHPPAPPALGSIHIESAKMLVDRVELLRRLPLGGTVMECGVDEGRFSQQILDISKPDRLILVDLWGSKRFNESKLAQVKEKFASQLAAGQVQIARMTSHDALRENANESLDWVYIDTDHSYATTHDELLLAVQKVKPNGYICGHDYTIGSWPSYHRYGVIEAVNAFCVEHHWQFAYLTHEPNRNLSFALCRIK